MAVFGIAVFLALFGTAKGGRGKNLSLAGAYRETQKGEGSKDRCHPLSTFMVFNTLSSILTRLFLFIINLFRRVA